MMNSSKRAMHMTLGATIAVVVILVGVASTLAQGPRRTQPLDGPTKLFLPMATGDYSLTSFTSFELIEQALLAPFLLPPAAPGSWLELQQEQAATARQAEPIERVTLSRPGGRVKVWYQTRYPGDDLLAARVLADLEDKVWGPLTELMGHGPLPDDGLPNNGGDGIRINEVMPKPEGGEFEWVELYNGGFFHLYLPLVLRSFPGEAAAGAPSGRAPAGAGTTAGPVDISGWQVTDEDGNDYTVPDALPAVPRGAYVLILFDGQGPTADDYDVSDGLATLHSPPGMVDILEDEADQVGLYSSSTHSPDTIADFVAWGAPPGEAAANATGAGLWQPSWQVGMFVGSGAVIEGEAAPSGQSIGLTPGHDNVSPDDWSIYRGGDVTPGAGNPMARIYWTTVDDGAVMGSDQVALGWSWMPGANYQFQMDDDLAFGSPDVDLVLDSPWYAPQDPPPAGSYWWRVRAIGPGLGPGAWSQPLGLTILDVGQAAAANAGGGANTIVKQYVIPDLLWLRQRKDTKMLCLDGCNEVERADRPTGTWDTPHAAIYFHGQSNCVRASIAMIVTKYGGSLSQDRLAYHLFENWGAPVENKGGVGMPMVDVGHDLPTLACGEDGSSALSLLAWALGVNGGEIVYDSVKRPFSAVQSWIDGGQPLLRVSDGHATVLAGYRVLAGGIEQVLVLDPWSGSLWENYDDLDFFCYYVAPALAPSVRSDEVGVSSDADLDGIVDFDEANRFATDGRDTDTDNDRQPDKIDMREYVFDASGTYDYRYADWDYDGSPKELDPDNDNGGSLDGCEDANHNGKYEPDLDETSNFNPAEDQACSCEDLAQVQNWTGQVMFSFTTSASSGGESINYNHSATVNLQMAPDYQTSGYVAWQDASLSGTGEVNDIHTASPDYVETLVGSGALYPGGPTQDDSSASLGVSRSTCTFEFHLQTGMSAQHIIDGDTVGNSTYVGLMDINDIPAGQLTGSRTVPAVWEPMGEPSWFVPGSPMDSDLELMVGNNFGEATVSWSFEPAD
ncbi:MAG TPA: lamin tail domain-containing protein [Anaerolineae bacterium]|nr:lamin tail domain-containing protein [Anaerolineae bacterium]